MVMMSVLNPPVKIAFELAFWVVTTDPSCEPGITGGNAVYVTAGRDCDLKMLAAGVPGLVMFETPPAVFGIEMPAAGIPSPAWVRSRTRKGIPARRFS